MYEKNILKIRTFWGPPSLWTSYVYAPLDATPDYKYYKYVLSAADPGDFWRERVVFEILEDTFDDDEFTENMEMSEAAALLGVTPEMVYREVQLRILHRKYRVTGGRIPGLG